jgi:hypothetical protein
MMNYFLRSISRKRKSMMNPDSIIAKTVLATRTPRILMRMMTAPVMMISLPESVFPELSRLAKLIRASNLLWMTLLPYF